MGKRKNKLVSEASDPCRNRRKVRRYVVIALCIAFFVAVNMVIIFALSAEDREESGARSMGVTAFVVRIIYPDYENMAYNDQLAAMESAHHYVRKVAHFLEYALLGFLTSGLLLFLRRYLSRRKLERWKTWFYPAEFCFLYAVTDEVHQIFSERGASPKDVLIDTAGAISGILLIQLIVWVVGSVRRKAKGKGRAGKNKDNGDGGEDSLALIEQEDSPCAPPDTV